MVALCRGECVAFLPLERCLQTHQNPFKKYRLNPAIMTHGRVCSRRAIQDRFMFFYIKCLVFCPVDTSVELRLVVFKALGVI